MTGQQQRSSAWPVEWFDQIDSTNEEARRRADTGPFANQWIAARQQTAGRGRLGRAWVSPTGNLFATALINWPYPLETATRLPFAAALAVRDTISHFAPGKTIALKWPNDVRTNEAKLSGILIESGTARGERWIAAGIGINVAYGPDVAEQATSSIADLSGTALTPEDALRVLAVAFKEHLSTAIDCFAPIRDAWLRHAENLGREITVSLGDRRLSGTFETLAPDGALILRLPNGDQETIRAGDVTTRQGSANASRD